MEPSAAWNRMLDLVELVVGLIPQALDRMQAQPDPRAKGAAVALRVLWRQFSPAVGERLALARATLPDPEHVALARPYVTEFSDLLGRIADAQSAAVCDGER